MVVTRSFVWLLIAALAIACVSTEAAAKWAPKAGAGDLPPSSSIGPDGDGGASPGPQGGADPDEPLGPERMAGTRVETPTQPSQTEWQQFIAALVRLDWVRWLGH